MENIIGLTAEERQKLKDTFRHLQELAEDSLQPDDFTKVRHLLEDIADNDMFQRNSFGLHPLLFDIQTSVILTEEIGLNRASLLAVMLHNYVNKDSKSLAAVKKLFGSEVANIISGLNKVNEIYGKTPVVETENFRDLILSFAEDMRVIFIIIASRVNLMRQIKDKGTEEERRKVAQEASVLYAPLAHKLGLYLIKLI